METSTEVSTELVRLIETSGVEKQKGIQITEALSAFFGKATEWNGTIEALVITKPDEVGKMKMAREGRLFLKNLRLDAEKLIKSERDRLKEAMSEYALEDKLWLKSGQMIETTFKNLEGKLEEKEKFAERWEENRKAELRAAREIELKPFSEFVSSGLNLGAMSEDDFQKTLAGAKLQYQADIDAKEAAERERVEKEEAKRVHEERKNQILPYWNFLSEDKRSMDFSTLEQSEWDLMLEDLIQQKKDHDEEQANLRAEADRLKAEADAREKEIADKRQLTNKRHEELKPYIQFVRDYASMIDLQNDEYLVELEGVKKAAELQWEEDKKKAEAELSAKIKEDEETHNYFFGEETDAAMREATDEEILLQLATTIETLSLPIVHSEAARTIINGVREKLSEVSYFIEMEVNSL